MLLAFMSLLRLQRQAERNEQTLKGLSCILLILPEERTKLGIEDCIDRNKPSTHQEFKFNTPEKTPKGQEISAPTKTVVTFVTRVTKPVHPTELPKPVTTSQPVKTAPAQRALEVKVDPVTLKEKTRLAGDEFWQDR